MYLVTIQFNTCCCILRRPTSIDKTRKQRRVSFYKQLFLPQQPFAASECDLTALPHDAGSCLEHISLVLFCRSQTDQLDSPLHPQACPHHADRQPFVHSRLDYCSTILIGLPSKLLRKLQSVLTDQCCGAAGECLPMDGSDHASSARSPLATNTRAHRLVLLLWLSVASHLNCRPPEDSR